MKLATSNTSTADGVSSNTTITTESALESSTATTNTTTTTACTTSTSLLEFASKAERDLEDEEDRQGEFKTKMSEAAVTTKSSKSKQQKIRMPQRKGGMQLWQFLYALLEDPDKRYGDLIEWTDNRLELEFRLLDPEAIAIWWGNIKHRANMTYERLSRSLRYYYDRGILKKMGGERYLYRFCVDPEEMYKHIGNSDSRPILKPMPLQVTKWMYSRMVIPHGIFFSSALAPPDYSTVMQQQQQHQQTTSLPPPPPYPGFPVDPFYLPNPIGYDYLTHMSQETETPYTNMPHYENQLHSCPLPEISNSTYIANTTLASGTTIGSTLCPNSPSGNEPDTLPLSISRNIQHVNFSAQIPTTSSYPSSPLDQTVSTTTTNYHSVVETTSSISNYHSVDSANSPVYSGSTCSGGDCEMALDEILPILASMEQSETLFDVTSSSSPPYSSPSASPQLPSTPYSTSFSSATNNVGYSQTFTSWLKTTEHDATLWNVN